MKRLGACIAVVLAIVGSLLLAAGPATAEADRHGAVAVRAKWVTTDPLNITSVVVQGPITKVAFTGHTTLTGDLAGHTTFTGRGTLDSRTGVFVAHLEETFFGSVAHLGHGTLHFSERFRQDATGALTVDARVVSGTHALEDVRGTITFAGFSDAQGMGNGTITGHLVSDEVQGD